MYKKLALILIIGLMAMGLMGCSESQTAANVAIDARFSDFYDLMGGETTLGAGQGTMLQDGSRLLQFTENALMIYDESLPAGERYNFEPLGKKFLTGDPGLTIADNLPGVRYLNGHLVYVDFIPFFDQLGGVRFVGQPLTEVRFNSDQNRYEQYFEKLGFYLELGDSQKRVHLIPYGLIACRQNYLGQGCSAPRSDAVIDAQDYLPQPFITFTQSLGDNFPGAPLTAPYLTADGLLEQVYENVVITVSPNDLKNVQLRQLPALTGIQPDKLAPALDNELMVFLPIDPIANLGHNVPTRFLQYIAQNGGANNSGIPTTELFNVNGIRRQCFTYYCLDFDPAAPPENQIHPAPLGHLYLAMQNVTSGQIKLIVWESSPTVAPGQEQILGVLAYNTTPNLPMQNMEPAIEINLPDGTVQSLHFPPTSTSGSTYLKIRLSKTTRGQIIAYKVCLSQPGSTPVCSSESWLVW